MRPRLILTFEDSLGLITEWLTWSTGVTVAWAARSTGTPALQVLTEADKLRVAYAPASGDPAVLRALNARGSLRILPDTAAGSYAFFSHGHERRAVFNFDQIDGATFAAVAVSGSETDVDWAPFSTLLLRLHQSSKPPTEVEANRWAAGVTTTPTGGDVSTALPIPVGPPRDEIEDDHLAEIAWEALIGLGPQTRDDAARTVAHEMRERGVAHFQRLRRDGALYLRVQKLLKRWATRGEDFDRPRRGMIRAILPDASEYTRDIWRTCLLESLPEERVERETAVRAAAQYAVEYYGLGHKRLVSGGRVDRGVRSAINSAIRQGLVGRHGVAFIEKSAAGSLVRSRPGEDEREPAVKTVEEETQTEVGNNVVVPGKEAARMDTAALALPIVASHLPTRTLNWAVARGYKTVGEIVAWDPGVFRLEPSVGRGTVKRTRTVLERLMGCTWEQARAESTLGSPNSQQDDPWTACWKAVNPKHRHANLEYIQLPARIRNYCERERWTTLEQLFSKSAEELRAEPNLGRASIAAIIEAVRQYIAEVDETHDDSTFLDAWQRHLRHLDPVERRILLQRAGDDGDAQTLQSIGAALGVSRERVRQVEVKAIIAMQRRPGFTLAVHGRLAQALDGAVSAPLSALAEDPYWSRIDQHRSLFDYLLRHILDSRYRVFSFGDQNLIATYDLELAADCQSRIRNLLGGLEYPTPFATVLGIVDQEAEALGEATRRVLSDVLEEEIHFEPGSENSIVTAFGKTKSSEVLAMLRASAGPIPIAELYEQVGRCQLPPEVLYFRRGVVGLKQHFADFDMWQARLVPRCVEIMESGPEARQWLVSELHIELCEATPLPGWLGHWQLGSLLRLSDSVEYLGRLRVALPSEQGRERLFIADNLREVLLAAGHPMAAAELLSSAKRKSDLGENAFGLALLKSPFVRVDEDLYGLLERDIPGGAKAISLAVSAVEDDLRLNEKALTAYEAAQLVQPLSPEHAAWTPEMTISVLRNEGGLRIARTGAVGLAGWDADRFPTRPQRLRELVENNGDTVSLSSIVAALAGTYGESPPVPTIRAELASVGFSITGERIHHSAQSPVTRTLASLMEEVPVEARTLYKELVSEEPMSAAKLTKQVEQYERAFEQESLANEYADLQTAEELADDSRRLLARFDDFNAEQRRIGQAAIRYFVLLEGSNADFDENGLDDDAEIMAAVMKYLEVQSEGSTAS